MEESKRLLGARIKELRRIKGLSQEKIAEIVGVDPKHISRIEVGKSYPSIDTLEKIAAALGMELKDFFEFAHHLKSPDNIIKDINRLIKGISEEKLRQILKIVRAIAR